MNRTLALLAAAALSVNASHLDELHNFKWTNVKVKIKTDCSLDKYPEVRTPLLMLNCM